MDAPVSFAGDSGPFSWAVALRLARRRENEHHLHLPHLRHEVRRLVTVSEFLGADLGGRRVIETLYSGFLSCYLYDLSFSLDNMEITQVKRVGELIKEKDWTFGGLSDPHGGVATATRYGKELSWEAQH